MSGAKFPDSDPRHHTAKMRKKFGELVSHLREDVVKVHEPKAQALFETAAEVLTGLQTAFEHYEEAVEPGMRHAA